MIRLIPRWIWSAATLFFVMGGTSPAWATLIPNTTNLHPVFQAGAGVSIASSAPVVNNDPAGTWQDQISAANNVGQTDTNKRPVSIINGVDTINGLPTIKFNRAGAAAQADVLINNAVDPLAAGCARKIVIMGRADSASDGGALFKLRGTSTPVAALQRWKISGSSRNLLYSDGATVNAQIGAANWGSASLTTIRSPFISACTAMTAPGALAPVFWSDLRRAVALLPLNCKGSAE